MFAKVFSAAAACALLAQVTYGHVVITSPIPYGKDSLNNSPLDYNGADFPCKQRPGVYDITQMNDIAVGVPQQLAFMGGATHGGGSCQVSVTLDKEPTVDSDWKVIHSIVGGCPNSAPGNADSSADFKGDAVYHYTMPDGMPNGQYTLAWTWFNKIGNREMYMNCAPINVTGGADNNDIFNSLPTMWVINIPQDDCTTVEGEDFEFPDPGKSVETGSSAHPGTSTTGPNCAAVTNKGAGSGSAGSTGSASSPATTGAASAYPTTSGSLQNLNAVGADATSAPVSSSPDAVATVTTLDTITADASAQPAETSAPAASASSSSSGDALSNSSPDPASSGTSSGSCASNSTPCSTDGVIVCIGASQWGMCDHGCAVAMELAAGTNCTDGTISKRNEDVRAMDESDVGVGIALEGAGWATHLRNHARRAKPFSA